MPTNPDAISAAITEAAAAGFRGRLIAQGQARAMIWRGGVLPPDAPQFSPQLSYDLHSYAYGLLGLGLRMLEMNGDPAQARVAFVQAATALESVMAKGNRGESDRDFHFVMAAASYHLAQLSARAYSLLAIVVNEENFTLFVETLRFRGRRQDSKTGVAELPPAPNPRRLGANGPLMGNVAAIWEPGRGKPSPAAEPRSRPTPSAGTSPQRPEKSERADRRSMTG